MLTEFIDLNQKYHFRLPFSFFTLFVYAVTLSGIAFIKLWLIPAGSSDLQWLLKPTVFLIHLFTGITFLFDPAQGFVSDSPIVISSDCSGINFFLTVSFISVFAFQRLYPSVKKGSIMFITLVVAAYFTTILTNTFRIVFAMRLNESFPQLSTGRWHEAEGVLIYFSFLLAYFFLTKMILKKISPENEKTSTSALDSAPD